MPIDKVQRFKVIVCHTCSKVIKRYDRSKFPGYHVPAEIILDDTRHHYKEKHPRKWRQSIIRGVEARKTAR